MRKLCLAEPACPANASYQLGCNTLSVDDHANIVAYPQQLQLEL